MAFDLSIFSQPLDWPTLDEAYLQQQLELAGAEQAVRFARLMAYYRNDQRECCGLAGATLVNALVDAADSNRPYVQAQEFGLPPRITGFRHDGFGAIFGGQRVPAIRRKEVVIENDIGWRVDAMVNYLFGQPVRISSLATDPVLRQKIQTALNAALEANGGLVFLQQMALFGHVYGFVDVLLRGGDLPSWHGHLAHESESPEREIAASATGRMPVPREADIADAASQLVFELVEADRAVPIVNAADYRRLDYYVQHFRHRDNLLDGNGLERCVMITEIIGPAAWQRYQDGELIGAGDNPLGQIPVVHIQNLPRPFCYEGDSEVDRLIPMQDELNTRLSDRANRISFQSFKMYLGRGIENFEDRPIAPGRMWSTDNPEASIQEFGGDPGSPSEAQHIDQVREALDKISGVPPVAAGVVRDRLGNLTSGNALRITLAGLLSKTAAKRGVYGAGLERMCELALAWLDAAGVLPTRPADRRVRLEWPPMLAETLADKLQEALIKRQLGVPADRVLAELGYEEKAVASG